MPDNVSTQYFETGNVSFKASAAVTGRRFVRPSANRTGGGSGGLSTVLDNVYVMALCGAGQKPAGVAKYDVPINGYGGVHGQPGMIVHVEAGAAITAGAEVESDATGRAIPLAAGRPAGQAMTGASGAGAAAEIKLY